MERQVINRIRERIKSYDLYGIQQIYQEILSDGRLYPLEYIYKQAFLCCCINNYKEGMEWLFSIYQSMDDIRKVVLRQMFFYGKILVSDKEWYEKNINGKIRSI